MYSGIIVGLASIATKAGPGESNSGKFVLQIIPGLMLPIIYQIYMITYLGNIAVGIIVLLIGLGFAIVAAGDFLLLVKVGISIVFINIS